ncbi:tRNA1(Val) (adenine(37)-N6)-methyltransferase [Clostridium oryzae]|uniref:tRNA1(Val) (Adenine(37)-N6)-methyltransferase n=1 Tax=Clostridium oryzae TaxID=1450648 RepID=A0A1V4IML3_9CLOT|nr:tRNA1(Val) (adenine(37)-N6)-methyltransferase [Clostridium oryzae]OPJ61278.1 tRNA1(Val) (adenine(37)-N6)-methyltransferase [Clostridium oryzae]
MEKLIRDDETLDDLQLNGIYLIQKKHSFRFGVDAVLLANFARVKKDMKVLDLCSGTGIVPFIICGKMKPEIVYGIEIQKEMVEMANRSAIYNKLQEKIQFIEMDLKDTDKLKKIEKVDVVTVNPPYKLCNSGIINEEDSEAIARHEICCNIDDVIAAAKAVLKDNGRLYMVHRPERIADIICAMRKYKIEPKVIRPVHPNTKKPPNIMLIEAQNYGGKFLRWEKPLYIYKDTGGYSEEIDSIYGRKI